MIYFNTVIMQLRSYASVSIPAMMFIIDFLDTTPDIIFPICFTKLL